MRENEDIEFDVEENSEEEQTNTVDCFSIAAEKETIINFNNAEKTASYYTLNIQKRKKLLELAKKYPKDVKITKQTEDAIEAEFPKKWIRVVPPRILTEEQHVRAVERGQALAAMMAEKRNRKEE